MKRSEWVKTLQQYKILLITFILSLALFLCAASYNSVFTGIMPTAAFLTWHSLFEFTSILAAFSVFIVTYYTYEESGSFRMIILGCTFLAMGILDTFHTLSYKGMAEFFIPNTGANRATTLWVLSRLIGSMGIAAAVFIPGRLNVKIKKRFLVTPTLLIAIGLFLLVTYYPGLFPAMYVDGKGLTHVKILLEYLIVLLLVIILVKVETEFRKTNSRQEYLFMFGLLLSIFSEFAFASYASVYDAYNYLGHIYKIIAYFIMFKAIYTENVKMPYREMEMAKDKLSEYSEGLNVLVRQRTRELEDMNERLLLDLEYAREMQRSLLPGKMPQDMPVLFNAVYLPAERLSGDFYNVIKLDESNVAVYIGDVAGHGVSAAMLTVFANQNIKPIKETEDTTEIIAPGQVLKNLYKAFNMANFKEETYLVVLYGIYNTSSRCFTYACGGINVPPLIIKGTGDIVEMDARGFAICKLGDIITPLFENRFIQLEHGDKILFYTDGLVEAEDSTGRKYTQEHLPEVIRGNSCRELADGIKADFLQSFGPAEKLKDDVTFLVMEIL